MAQWKLTTLCEHPPLWICLHNGEKQHARSLARIKRLMAFCVWCFSGRVCWVWLYVFHILLYFFPLPLLTSCESAVREEMPSSWTLFLMQKQVLMCDPPNKGRNPPQCFLVGSCKFLHTYFICRAIGVQLARLCNLCLFKCVVSWE